MPAKPKQLTVAAVQMRFRPSIGENCAFITRQVRELSALGADAILFPECAVTGYNVDFSKLEAMEVSEALAEISAAAKASGCHVLVGSPTFQGKRLYNSLVVFDRRGREVFIYSKIHLTPRDARHFAPGNKLAFFKIDGIPCTAIICHERRYPELVRLPVMMGAQIVFHPNAGLDSLEVSKRKRKGRDGISVRAFENQVYYIFSNSVGPQGDGLWSAGDSKIVAPDSSVPALADNRFETGIIAHIDLGLAGRKYAVEALTQPAFLRAHWNRMMQACHRQLRAKP